MTDQERIANMFGISVEQLNATSSEECRQALSAGLTKDERSIARQFDMSAEEIGLMVSERMSDLSPSDAAEALSGLGEVGRGRLLALNVKVAHRLFSQAAKSSDPQRDMYQRLSVATSGQKIQFNALHIPLH